MLSRLFKAGERVLSNLVNKKDLHMASNSPKLQELYDLCKDTFTGKAPSPTSMPVQKLCSLLDTVSPADVGLQEEAQDDDRGYGVSAGFNRVGRWAQPITFLDIHECDTFTMCIFCFPTSSVIPLHDHPKMTVFSKILYGSLHVKAYDWVEPPCIIPQDKAAPPARLAKLVSDKVITPESELPVLYPKTGGNLHCFTALTPCAVLDILTPPYNESVGRSCSYYMDYPFSTFALEEGMKKMEGKEDGYAWLVEIDTPDDLHMRPGLYTGPTIQV